MKKRLKIMTLNMNGKLPFSLHFKEADLINYLNNSCFDWQHFAEGYKSPYIITRLENRVSIRIFFTGSITIFNPPSPQEAEQLYDVLLDDLRIHAKNLFK